MGILKQKLVDARELLSKPENWTKGTRARDFYRRSVDTKAPEACQWCLLGALDKVSDCQSQFVSLIRAMRTVSNANSSTALFTFNDRRSTKHADVIALFDRAIESLEKNPLTP